MTNATQKPVDSVCLMTVTTDSYLPGTLAMIGSFLTHNPWFHGDIQVVAPELADHNRQKLKRLLPQVNIVSVRPELARLLTQNQEAAGITPERFARFAGLDAFAPNDYDKVLFCDSDIVFCGDVWAATTQSGSLLVTPDGPCLRGNPRSRETFAELPGEPASAGISNTFNAGFMCIGKELRNPVTYANLLAVLTDDFWQKTATNHTDQAIINLQLAGQQTVLGPEFNYLLGHAQNIELPFAQAKVFHFNGPRKPWEKDHISLLINTSEAGKYACDRWQAASRKIDPEPVFYGAKSDMQATVKRHVFLLCPNNSGSTFLSKAIGTSPEVWSLYREGQHVLGFTGFAGRKNYALLWAGTAERLKTTINPDIYDWPANKKCWYFQAQAQTADAPVFFTKAPPFLAYPEALRQNFDNTRFIIMVRNPYAMLEAIFRHRSKIEPNAETLLRLAANHIITCFELQRQNRQRYQDIATFFTYEEMCADPVNTATKIKAMAPEINTLQLDQRLLIKGRYYERLRNMNSEQIGRLTPEQVTIANRIFRPKQELLASFGYEIQEARA